MTSGSLSAKMAASILHVLDRSKCLSRHARDNRLRATLTTMTHKEDGTSYSKSKAHAEGFYFAREYFYSHSKNCSRDPCRNCLLRTSLLNTSPKTFYNIS